jgi:hypothetical protein
LEFALESKEEVVERSLVLGENDQPLVVFPLLAVAQVLRHDFQEPVEPRVCIRYAQRPVGSGEPKTIQSMVNRRNFAGEVWQEWF